MGTPLSLLQGLIKPVRFVLNSFDSSVDAGPLFSTVYNYNVPHSLRRAVLTTENSTFHLQRPFPTRRGC